MITMTAKKDKAICILECSACFQPIMFRLDSDNDYTKCPYCLDEIPSPEALLDRVMARIAYFYSAEDEPWYD